MTRREEIVRKAMNSYPDCPERGFGTRDYEYPEFHDDEREAFICGAEWADKTMVDKLCDWIQCMALDYMQGDIIDVKWGSMFADLRKYVENGDD